MPERPAPQWEMAPRDRRVRDPNGASLIYPKMAAGPHRANKPIVQESKPARLRDWAPATRRE